MKRSMVSVYTILYLFTHYSSIEGTLWDEGGFGACVENWCLQADTNQQYTRCEEARDGGNTCINPEIKYGTTEGGIPFKHSINDYDAWCKQIFSEERIGSITTGKRDCATLKGLLFWRSGFDEDRPHWCDYYNGTWKDTSLVSPLDYNLEPTEYEQYCDNTITAITCKKSTINCPCLEVEGPLPCSTYSTLDDSWRHIDYEDRVSLPGFCDQPGRGNKYATYTGLVTSWYRFTGASGTKLPTAPAPEGGHPRWNSQVCGSTATAYISSGGHPTIQEGIVTRDLCWEWGDESCKRTSTVKVAACKDIHGDYFVYELDPVPRCDTAYCAID